MQLGHDASRGLDFYRAIGGGVEFGERAEDALHREFREELDVSLDEARLLAVVENIFVYEGEHGHEYAHVFAVESAEIDAIPLTAQLQILDEGSMVEWVPIADLRNGIRPLFPDSIAVFL